MARQHYFLHRPLATKHKNRGAAACLGVPSTITPPYCFKTSTAELSAKRSVKALRRAPHLRAGRIIWPSGRIEGGVRRQCRLQMSHLDGIGSAGLDGRALCMKNNDEFKLTWRETPVCLPQGVNKAGPQVELSGFQCATWTGVNMQNIIWWCAYKNIYKMRH